MKNRDHMAFCCRWEYYAVAYASQRCGWHRVNKWHHMSKRLREFIRSTTTIDGEAGVPPICRVGGFLEDMGWHNLRDKVYYQCG